jgi:hypothetical protein
MMHPLETLMDRFGEDWKIIGGCSDDSFEREFDPALPRPYDRDRFLTTQEDRIHGGSLPIVS